MTGQPQRKASDGLPALLVGPWSTEKTFFFKRYFYIFNQGMKNRWGNRVYVDLFSGPGRSIIKSTGEEIDGSPILALKTAVPFTHHYFNDINLDFIKALQSRCSTVAPLSQVSYFNRDANEAALKIIEALKTAGPNPLVLTLVDSWQWEISFEAIRTLTRDVRMDLVVTFHSGGIKRTATKVLPKLDNFMGSSQWRRGLEQPLPGQRATRMILDFYEEQLRSIGYNQVDDMILVRNTTNVPLYYLVYASKHKRGLEFWQRITTRDVKGQRRLIREATQVYQTSLT